MIFLFRQMIRISTFYFSGHASRRFDPIRSDGTILLLEGCARGAETPRRLHVGLRPREALAAAEIDFDRQHKIVAMRSVLKKNKHRWKGESSAGPRENPPDHCQRC